MSEETTEFDAYKAKLPRKTVPLSRPIPAHGGMVSTLTIVEPLMENLEGTEIAGLQSPALVLRQVISQCAGIPPSSVRLLGIRDVVKCQEALAELGFTVSDLYQLVGIIPPTALQALQNGSAVALPSAPSPTGRTGSA